MDFDFAIIGDGTLGKALVERLSRERCSFYQTSRKPSKGQIFFDLNEKADLPPAGLFFLCASETSIALCEKDPVRTRQINVIRQIELLKNIHPAKGVILSTNHVFENTLMPGINSLRTGKREYARQKIELENYALDNGHFVVRMTKVVDRSMPLLTKWLDCLRSREEIYPFEDMLFAPVYIDDAIDHLINLEKPCSHVSACKDISYSKAAFYMAEKMLIDRSLIKPISCVSKDLRPFLLTALETEKIISPFRAFDQLLEFYVK